MKVGIIGCGSWGLALGRHIANNGHDVTIWAFSKEEKECLNNTHTAKLLEGVSFPENLVATNDLKDAASNKDIVLHVTPSAFAKNIFKNYYMYLKNTPILICTKGFDKEEKKTFYEIFSEYISKENIAVLTGPTHAEEVSKDIISAMVVASSKAEIVEKTLNIFDKKTIRLYESDDIIGTELGGALKNIIAFCAGVLVPLELGDNTFAALCTRGLVEMNRFSTLYGGKNNTIYGLSGLGDLIVTCMSKHSRNRRAGILIGKGLKEQEVRKEIGMVIESFDNIETAKYLADAKNIDMPILDASYDILFNNVSPKDAISKLMERDLKKEFYE